MVSADLSKLTYASNNKNKTANISAAAAFIYNGLPYDGDSNLDFKPEDGNIELIDNNNDGIYDVVFIQSYKTVVVDYVSEFAEMIQGIYAYDPENIAVNLNSENGESIISIVSGDKLLLPEDIERLDVLRILEAENGAKRKVTVELSRETVRGSVAEIADKNSETVLYVDGRELVLSATFKKAIEKGDVNAKKISIGKQYNFHLDSTGKVAYATELDSALTYAIVKSTCSLDGIDPVYMIKVFTQDGEWMELTLSDKIMYNGERINAEAAIQDLNLAVQTGSSITVIGYELDKEGKIKTMEAAIENCSDSERLNSQTNLSCIYRSHNNSLNSQLFIAESPIVWTVLSDKMGEDDSYSISSIGSIFTEGWGYDVSVYDIDEYGFAQILVVYLTEDFYSLRNDERQVFVVDGVGEALLPDGTIGQQVTGGMGGYENLKFYLEDEEIAADLCPGDVISVFLDKNGNLLSLDKYYSFKNDGFSYKTASDLWISLAILQGRILKYDIERKFIEIDCGDNNWIVRTSVVPSVLIYNTSRGTVEKGTLDDLVQGSFVVAKINYFKLISIVVIV